MKIYIPINLPTGYVDKPCMFKVNPVWMHFFVFFCCLGFSTNFSYAVSTIIIDPGHGGTDPGAINSDDNALMEKNINLIIAQKLVKLIQHNLPSMNIITTRDADFFVSLGERTKITNQFINKDPIFISIHTNSHNTTKKVKGIEVFYHYTSNSTIANFRLGEYMRKAIPDEDDSLKRGVSTILNVKAKEDSKILANCIGQSVHMASNEKIRRVEMSNLYVVSYGVIPAILVEVGFISNDKLRSTKYLEQLAKGIFLGILDYMKITNKG